MCFCSSLFCHSLSRQTRASLLLVFGLTTVLLLSFGSGRVARAEAGSFYAEICTSKGIAAKAGAQDFQANSGQLNHPDGGNHDECCKLCGVAVSLLSADNPLAVSPAPTFPDRFFAGRRDPPAVATHPSHPPRGPPLA